MTTLIALLCSSSVWSQETLTVYDGTVTSQKVPAYIYYFDDFTRSQFVIPAADLVDMKDGNITAIKFYTTNSNVPYTTASTVDVYLKEVGYTSINDFEETASCTTVYQGTLSVVADGDGGLLTIELDTPFTYGDGNLLIGIENTTDAEYKVISFYGQEVTNASIYGNNSSSLASVTATQQNFIPKTTLEYIPSGGVYYYKPTGLAASSVTDTEATITWNAPSSTLLTGYAYQYKPTAYTD